MDKPRSVKIPALEYELVAAKAEASSRTIQWLIAKAIRRCYGNGAKKP
jgi:hypothetical protein